MKLIKILAALIVLLVLASLTLSNHTLDYSPVINTLSRDNATLKHANMVLRATLATRGSLTYLAPQLAHSEYVEPQTQLTLATPAPLAFR